MESESERLEFVFDADASCGLYRLGNHSTHRYSNRRSDLDADLAMTDPERIAALEKK